MDKKLPFYGTPLLKILADRHEDKEGFVNSRQARLNRNQTVRDAQGRQRFHGAFTGGFSAGYFNTVDSIEGFRPKQFVSHRNRGRDGRKKFTHKPEDYMDDEDLSEFGIAPEKIRVRNDYKDQDVNAASHNSIMNVIRPSIVSFGERILMRMNRKLKYESNVQTFNPKHKDKDNFHGLGYQPLKRSIETSPRSRLDNPLIAMTREGKRLKISGEAFGTGVLDDEDDHDLGVSGAFAVDDLKNYDFSSSSTNKASSSLLCHNDPLRDHGLFGSKLFKKCNTLKTLASQVVAFPLPIIPEGWQEPRRTKPLSTTVEPKQELYLNKCDKLNAFSGKFIVSSVVLETTTMETKTGLVRYSDLKVPGHSTNETESTSETLTSIEACVERVESRWKPCSLLCKRFDVQVPICEPDPKSISVEPKTSNPYIAGPSILETAPMHLKREIFNIINESPPYHIESDSSSGESDKIDDDEPQFVDLVEQTSSFDRSESCTNAISDDQDVIIIGAQVREEPEVIEIINSSSPSSSDSAKPLERQPAMSPDQSDSDDYGPPLPPTLETLMSLEARKKGSSGGEASKSGIKRKKSYKRTR